MVDNQEQPYGLDAGQQPMRRGADEYYNNDQQLHGEEYDEEDLDEEAHADEPSLGNMGDLNANQTGMGDTTDMELKKKVVLYYNQLFQATWSQWFTLLQQKNYNRLSKEQYVELNVRI